MRSADGVLMPQVIHGLDLMLILAGLVAEAGTVTAPPKRSCTRSMRQFVKSASTLPSGGQSMKVTGQGVRWLSQLDWPRRAACDAFLGDLEVAPTTARGSVKERPALIVVNRHGRLAA